MSEPFQESPNFEVRCWHCNVSFPIGTKRCVHCGEKIGRPAILGRPGDLELGEMPVFDPTEEAAEAEPQRGRGFRLGVTALWLIAALLSAVVRACQEG